MNKYWNIDEALKSVDKLNDFKDEFESLTESDTRSKLIDHLLIGCLGWQESDIHREERCKEASTYLDYKLSTNTPIYIVEAKKASLNFELPKSSSRQNYKIGGVLKNSKVLLNAMIQARDYAISKGISFCMVTNGHEYVFFRSQNQLGIEWMEHTAIIFRNIEEIKSNFDLFCRLISKSSAQNGELQKALSVSENTHDLSAQFKTLNVEHLKVERNKDRNPLFPYIGEIIHKVFQDLASETAESEILEHCYVDSPKKQDKNKPYLDINSKNLTVTKKEAGEFQKRILTTLQAGKTNHKEIVLLLGSVGVGKSTFIQRFRKVLAKKEIDEKGIWIYLNFKHFSDTGQTLDSFVFNQIDTILHEEYEHLGLGEWGFIKHAYHSEFSRLKKGQFAPLYQKSPEEFEMKFGEKIDEWSSTNIEGHLTKILKAATSKLRRSVFLIFDNADQLAPDTQNDIFLVAEKLAANIGCYALLSMREESYWKTRDSGPLNAFHTTAYNVQQASFEQVLSKRFKYARSLLVDEEFIEQLESLDSGYMNRHQ